MGKRNTEQAAGLFVTQEKLSRSPEHVFYDNLSKMLREAGFSRHATSG